MRRVARVVAAGLVALAGPMTAQEVAQGVARMAPQVPAAEPPQEAARVAPPRSALDAAPWPAEVVRLAEALPVQAAGRVQPLRSVATTTLLRLSGRRELVTAAGERRPATWWLLDLVLAPERALGEPVFLVRSPEVLDAIGVPRRDERSARLSFEELRPATGRLFLLAAEVQAEPEDERATVEEQILALAADVQAVLALADLLAFARDDVALGGSAAVAEALGRAAPGRRTATVAEVVGRLDELVALRRELEGLPGMETDRAAVSALLLEASEAIGRADALALVPPAPAAPPGSAWLTPLDVFLAAAEGEAPEGATQDLARLERVARAAGDPAALEAALRELVGSTTARARARGEARRLAAELAYARSGLLPLARWGFLAAFLLAALLWLRPRARPLLAAALAATASSALLLAAAVAWRCWIRGRPPVTTLYESVLFVTLVAVLLGLVLELVGRRRVALPAAALLGAVGLLVADRYEALDGADTMPSLVAVLDANLWLATHVTTITIGYAAGLLAAVLGSASIVARVLGLRRDEPGFHADLDRMVRGTLAFSLVACVVGTLLGGVWANDSWGRFWGWDPKENGALLIVLWQLAILHGRLGGHLREHGTALAAAFGGTVVAFAWWGVNLLGVGLHAYGFTGGVQRALWSYYLLQWSVVALGVLWLLARPRPSGSRA